MSKKEDLLSELKFLYGDDRDMFGDDFNIYDKLTSDELSECVKLMKDINCDPFDHPKGLKGYVQAMTNCNNFIKRMCDKYDIPPVVRKLT